MEDQFLIVAIDVEDPLYIYSSKTVSVQASTRTIEQARFEATTLAAKHGIPFGVLEADDFGSLPIPAGVRVNPRCVAQPSTLWHHRNRLADERYLGAVHWAIAQVMVTLEQWLEQDELLVEAIAAIEQPGLSGQYHRSEVAAALIKQRAELAQYTLMTLNEVPDLDDFSPVTLVNEEASKELVA